jgi:aminopeptidase N
VTYSYAYDAAAAAVTLTLTQAGFEAHGDDAAPWDFPVSFALVTDGVDSHEQVHRFDTATATIVVGDVQTKPDFVSVARAWSFFGTVADATGDAAALEKQALTDPDTVNRYFAYRAIADAEKARLIRLLVQRSDAKAAKKENGDDNDEADDDVDIVVSAELVRLHMTILTDEKVTASTRALILRLVVQRTLECFIW